MSKLILSASGYDQTDIFVSSIMPEQIMELSDKVFVSKYGRKSNTRIVQDAKTGNERNYRIILTFQTGKINYQLQSKPISGEMAKQLGFKIDATIEKYEDIGEMLGKLERY